MNERHDRHCCQEYSEVSRRGILRGAAVAGLTAAIAPSWLPKVAFAQSGPTRDVLISVYLRGGADGLTMCVPYFDRNYYAIRPGIAIPEPTSSKNGKAIDLDGRFGLPQALSQLKPAWDNGHLAIVHAAGAQNWSRSHFDAQKWMEASSRDIGVNTGWIGRHLATINEMRPGSPLRGISLTYGMVLSMNGGPKSLPIPDPEDFDFGGRHRDTADMVRWIATQYSKVQDETKAAILNMKNTMATLDAIRFRNYAPKGGAVYSDDGFGYSLKATAALIRANVGVEAIHIDLDGWDTHAEQGPIGGYMASLMNRLGRNLGAFYRDLSFDNKMGWTMVVLSEFGRTAIENGAAGTDHGTGNCVFVMGGAVNGQRVYGRWPGLARNQLLDGYDLAATTDYRAILAEIVKKRLGNTKLSTVFPGYTPQFLGIVT